MEDKSNKDKKNKSNIYEKEFSVFNTVKRINKSNKKRLSKCPVCGSKSIVSSEIGMRCKKCGYVNKSNEKINKELKENKK